MGIDVTVESVQEDVSVRLPPIVHDSVGKQSLIENVAETSMVDIPLGNPLVPVGIIPLCVSVEIAFP